MTRDDLLAYLRRYKLAVQASVAPDGTPQAAVVGFGVSDDLEIVFDTVTSTRKYPNLRADPRVALVVGWDDRTAQIEGLADFPSGEALERIREVYFIAYPDGRDRLAWPGITHVRVRPTWVRVSDYTTDPPRIEEMSGEALGVPAPPPPPRRRGFRSLTPRIVCDDPAAQVRFLRDVFGALGEAPEGRPAELRIGDALVMISGAGERGVFPAFAYVYVDDADTTYRRALEAGATSLEPPSDLPYGDRRAMVRDPFGNVWQIAHVTMPTGGT